MTPFAQTVDNLFLATARIRSDGKTEGYNYGAKKRTAS